MVRDSRGRVRPAEVRSGNRVRSAEPEKSHAHWKALIQNHIELTCEIGRRVACQAGVQIPGGCGAICVASDFQKIQDGAVRRRAVRRIDRRRRLRLRRSRSSRRRDVSGGRCTEKRA